MSSDAPNVASVGVPAVVRWPPHVDDEHIDMRRTQPVDSLSGKGMLMDVAPNDEYWLLGLKRRQRRLLGRDHGHRLRRRPNARLARRIALRQAQGTAANGPQGVAPTAILGFASRRTTV